MMETPVLLGRVRIDSIITGMIHIRLRVQAPSATRHVTIAPAQPAGKRAPALA
jgi:hypothetical protein